MNLEVFGCDDACPGCWLSGFNFLVKSDGRASGHARNFTSSSVRFCYKEYLLCFALKLLPSQYGGLGSFMEVQLGEGRHG